MHSCLLSSGIPRGSAPSHVLLVLYALIAASQMTSDSKVEVGEARHPKWTHYSGGMQIHTKSTSLRMSHFNNTCQTYLLGTHLRIAL